MSSRSSVFGSLRVAIVVSMVGWRAALAQPAPAQPAAAQLQKILVRSVTGGAVYLRGAERRQLTGDSVLEQGDTLVCDIGSVVKLEFQHPTSGAVLSAAILYGYTQMTVAEASQQGENARTQLDVPQGVLRAGVVRTAVPPSYRVRTPRVVVGIRGSEIRELQVSDDQGDVLLMGREGIAMTHDAWGSFRSQRYEQGTRKRVTGDRRFDNLLRAIENERMEHRIFLNGPHRSGTEDVFDEYSLDPFEFSPGDRMKREGNPDRDRALNQSRGALPKTIARPQATAVVPSKPPSQGPPPK